MKNFKRVISAVIALAISVSSFAAVSASSFTDVADTAAYAEAVEVLSALGIVNGYEDGSFQPDGEITRAEAATMIVGALNMTEDAKASAGTSKFADVNTDASWATGYVNVGVAQGFIAGMNDTTFAPKDNVTYAQMCVMLTKITGYGDYAAANSTASDWSAGYTSMAASVGINKGVQVSKDAKLTRAQVAQMLYNALLTPQLGVTEYTFSGNTYSQLDGKQGRDFKTLLSDKFDGYQVTAMITATGKSGAGLDNDELYATVEKADYYDGSEVKDGYKTNVTSPVYLANQKFVIAGSFNPDANLFQSGKAIFITNEYDEKEMVYFATTGKTEVKDFDAADYVKNADLGTNAYATSGKVRFDTKYYTMKAATTAVVNPVSLYVNGALYATFSQTGVYSDTGAPVTSGVTPNALLDKFLGDAQGTVTLIKGENENGYSKIFVNYYEVAQVASVSYKANATTIDFTLNNAVDSATNAVTSSIANKIVINDDSVEDGDVSVSVMLGDKEIGLNDIQEDDIIAIKTDLNDLVTKSKTDPKFIDILVSRDTASGKLTSINDDDEEITIDSKTYTAVDFAALKTASTNGKFAVGEIYKVTVDPFGRIYDYEATETTKNYAILEKVSTGNDTVTLVMGDGSYKAFDLSGSSTATLANANKILNGQAYDAAFAPAGTTIATVASGKADPQYRVVEYTTKSSTGAVSALNITKAVNAPTAGSTVATLEYTARTGKLGSYSVSDSTKIVNMADYKNSGSIGDYKKMATSELADGEDYTAYVYNKVGTFYSFVLVEKAGDTINASSRFAVARGVAGEGTSEAAGGDKCLTMDVLNNGKEQTMEFATSVNVNGAAKTSAAALTSALKAGSAFFYDTDSDGLVSDVWVIYDYSQVTGATYTAMNSAFTTSTLGTGDGTARLFDGTKWALGLQKKAFVGGSSDVDVQLAFGVVVSRDSKSIDLGVVTPAAAGGYNVIDKNKADSQQSAAPVGIYNFSFADDCAAYSYSPYDTVNTKLKDKLVLEASASALKASNFKLFETANDSDVIFWKTTAAEDTTAATIAPNAVGNNIEDYANYALVMLVDDEVVAVYEILR